MRGEPTSSARGRRQEDGWLFEPKLDGWRAMVRFDTALTVRTRNGHDITSAVPELAVRPPVLDGSSAVVDGELVAGAGTPEDFDGIAGRVASRRRAIPHATTTPNRVGDPELGRA